MALRPLNRCGISAALTRAALGKRRDEALRLYPYQSPPVRRRAGVGLLDAALLRPHADQFDVKIIEHKDYPFFEQYEGREYLRDGVKRHWRNDDLQSFTPLRFMPPELMGYQGRAVVVDPDVFAVGDVYELLTRDMAGKAIMCRTRSGTTRLNAGNYASSVMLLDCAKLTHWRVEEQFAELFTFERDYRNWINLAG